MKNDNTSVGTPEPHKKLGTPTYYSEELSMQIYIIIFRNARKLLLTKKKNGMNTVKKPSPSNTNKIYFNSIPFIDKVIFHKTELEFVLSDKRRLFFPINCFPVLQKATAKQRKKQLNHGYVIFWEELDEVIRVDNLLDGSIKTT